MMRRLVGVTAIVGVLGLATISGCQSKNHEKWVKDADNRWLALRSGLKLQMAQDQFETGDLDLAEKTVKEAAAMDPTNARLHLLAGRIALERNQLERSYHLFNLAIEQDEQEPEAYYYRGVVQQRFQRFDEAYESYAKAYELEKDNAAYLLATAEMLVALDRRDEAKALLEQKLSYFGQNAALRVALAHIHAIEGEHARAADFFAEAAMLEPDEPKLQEELASQQLAAGRHEQAIKTLRVLLKQPKWHDRTDLKRTLAKAYVRAERIEEGRALYLELAKSPDGRADDWMQLAQLALNQDDLFGAIYAANQAINVNPRNHEAYLLAGVVWQRRGKLDEALRMFDRASELAPQQTRALILRGISLERAGRKAAAAEAYAEALRRQPDDARARHLLSRVSVDAPDTP